MKLNTHLHIVLRIRILGAIPPLQPIYSCCNVLIKHRDKFIFIFFSFFFVTFIRAIWNFVCNFDYYLLDADFIFYIFVSSL